MRNALRRWELTPSPLWLCGPLVVLGATYLIGVGLGIADRWVYFVYALVIASLAGLFLRWRYHVSVVERSEDWVLVRCERRHRVSRHPRVTSESSPES